MPILPTRRTGAALCVVLATSILTVALACSDSLAPHTPRGTGGPRFLYQDPALESPPSASGSIDLPPMVTAVNGMSTVVGHFPYGTVVRFDVSGSHILSSVTGRDGSGSYGLKGRSCQTGDVGTTSFAGTNTGWDACNAPIGSTQTNYSDYISVVGDVYLYHAGDGGSTPPYPDCTHDCFYIGGGSQLTLTRIEASLDLTTSDAPAQSAGVYVVSPGTSLMFGWAVSPATVSSAGGDIKLGAVTNSSSWEITRPGGNVVGCPYFPFASGNNYRYCQVRADSAITVKLTAITNGAWKSKSVQIIPRRNFEVTGPTAAVQGDTEYFGALLDGQPVSASAWRWHSDTDPNDTDTGSDVADHLRKRVMTQSGYMVAQMNYAGGGMDIDSVHVTVQPLCVTGDSLLDQRALRDGLVQLWDEAYGGAPGDRLERGGYLYQNPSTGEYFFQEVLSSATLCSWTDPNGQFPNAPPTSWIKARVHVHPYRPMIDSIPPGTCAHGPVTGWGHPDFWPSPADDSIAERQGVPEFVVDASNVYRTDGLPAPTDTVDKQQKWSRTQLGCTLLPPPITLTKLPGTSVPPLPRFPRPEGTATTPEYAPRRGGND